MKNVNKNRSLWGLALVIVGTIIALNTLGFTQIDIFFDGWWTLFIIIPSAIGLWNKEEKIGNLIGLAIGLALLFSSWGLLDLSLIWQLLVPAIIIMIGLRMIFSSSFNRESSKKIKELKANRPEAPKDTATFSSHTVDYDGEIFEGGVLDAVFGSIKYDLRGARIEKDCVITASAVFSSIDIILPEYLDIEIDSSAFFGGVTDKRRKTDRQDKQVAKPLTLYIEANSIFGGINII